MNTLCLEGTRSHFDIGWLDTRHSEFNTSATEAVHCLQSWSLPERTPLTPRYVQVATASLALNGLGMNGGDGACIKGEASLAILAGAPAESLFFNLV